MTSVFESLRRKFDEPNGRWLTVGDQVEVLNLIDVAEAAAAVLDYENQPSREALSKLRALLGRFA